MLLHPAGDGVGGALAQLPSRRRRRSCGWWPRRDERRWLRRRCWPRDERPSACGRGCRTSPSPAPRCSALRASRPPATRAARGRPGTSATPGTEEPTACRLPSVIVPVLSSSRVLMSPAASTARPLMAITLCWIQPVHARDADRRQQAADRGRDEADEERDQDRRRERRPRVARERLQGRHREQEDHRQSRQQDRERDLVRRLLARRPLDQGDHPVDERLPGLAVIRMMRWSDSTRVPPVTAERSPPDSRMTGADSPVIADSSTEATPVDDLAVARDDVARRADHHVPLRSRVAGMPSNSRRVPAGTCSAWPAPGGGPPAAHRPAPSPALPPSPRRSWRTAR